MQDMNDKYRFVCRKDGRKCILAFKEAWLLLWACNIGWIRVIEWMRYSIENHRVEFFLSQRKVPDAGRFFGAVLLSRGYRPLTIDRYCGLLERSGMNGGLFNAHAARFNRAFNGLPADLRPFEFMRMMDDSRYGIPAYRLRPPMTCFIIEKVDPTCGLDPDDFEDWEAFRQPPPNA